MFLFLRTFRPEFRMLLIETKKKKINILPTFKRKFHGFQVLFFFTDFKVIKEILNKKKNVKGNHVFYCLIFSIKRKCFFYYYFIMLLMTICSLNTYK